MKFASRTEKKIWTAGAVTMALSSAAAAATASGAVDTKQHQHQVHQLQELLQGSRSLPSYRFGGAGHVAQRNLEETCNMIDVSGSEKNDGIYVDLGWTSVDKPVFFSTGRITPAIMLFSEGGLPVSSGEDGATRRRLLAKADDDGGLSVSSDEDGATRRTLLAKADDDGGLSVPSGEDGATRRKLLPKGAGDGAAALRKKVSGLKSFAATSPLEGKMPAVSAIRDATETLATCEMGYWVLLPFSLEKDMVGANYPMYMSFDCADHPVDISSSWYMIEAPDLEKFEEDMEGSQGLEDLSAHSVPDFSLSLACPDGEEGAPEESANTEAEASVCINLGADGCESKEECCTANDINMNAKCWDGRCCNKTDKPCTKDKQCCDGLSCMDGFCANPVEGTCVSLGVSGCAKSDDCCSANEMNADAKCKQGRCCNKSDGDCDHDVDCCDGYMCDNSVCVEE